MTYPLDMPRRRTRQRLPWWGLLIAAAIVVPVVFVIDGAIALAVMWVLTEFGVDAPFWPTFVGVLLVGLMTGNGCRR